MKIEEIKLCTEVFKPFTLHTSGGLEIFIPHEDYIYFPPKGDTFIAVNGKGQMYVVPAEHVASISN